MISSSEKSSTPKQDARTRDILAAARRAGKAAVAAARAAHTKVYTVRAGKRVALTPDAV